MTFFKFIGEKGILYEDDMMDYFLASFKGYALRWFGKRTITSFAVFLEAFCKCWCSNDIDQWISTIIAIKKFYDAQNIFEEGPRPPLTEENYSISLTKDEDIIEECHDGCQCS